MTFNLVVEDWIPVLYTDGRYRRVGIRTALLEAGGIRQLAASNPMDNVALLRFLLAVLMWCTDDAKRALAAMKDRSTGIPEDWLAKLNNHDAAFNLLGDGVRFYQDQNTPANDRPIGDLLVEFPTETKIAHFRRVRDMEYGLCPACCALGIIRFCGWANAYGKGHYTSAVNGPTPAYSTTQGSTLLQTLRINQPKNVAPKREPPWICADPPKTSDLDMVTVFAWRSRRLWLGDPDESKGRCSYCGEIGALIRRHAFTGNWKPPFPASGNEKKFWPHDSHLILVDKNVEDDAETTATDGEASMPRSRSRTGRAVRQITLGFPSPGARVAAHARFWRRALSAALGANTTESEAATIRITGPAANKGLYQDAAAVSVPRDCRLEPIKTVRKAVESLSNVLRWSTPNPKQQHPERKAALDALSPSLEARLRQGLNASDDPKQLKEQLQPVVRDVVYSTTPGSPLRRREAMQRAVSALDQTVRAITAKIGNQSTKDDAFEATDADLPQRKRNPIKREAGA